MDLELRMTPEEKAEFETRFDTTGDACWTFDRKPPHIHKLNERGGYASFKGEDAHRVMWVNVHGPIPLDPKKIGNSKNEHLEVCHVCNTRNCVRPGHLYLDDHEGNHEYKEKCGRTGKGVVKSKLNAERVMLIRDMVRAGQSRESVPRFGASYAAVLKAVAGTGPYGTFQDVPGALGWSDGPYQKVPQAFFDFPKEAS